LNELLEWLNNSGGKVAIHDATNSTIARRKTLRDRVSAEKNMYFDQLTKGKHFLLNQSVQTLNY
jgi:hypothetical protein